MGSAGIAPVIEGPSSVSRSNFNAPQMKEERCGRDLPHGAHPALSCGPSWKTRTESGDCAGALLHRHRSRKRPVERAAFLRSRYATHSGKGMRKENDESFPAPGCTFYAHATKGEFAITPLRIIKKTGFLTRRVSQIPLDKVQDLHLVATLWGRWLSYGNVEVESAANDGPVVFRRIQNPEAFRNVVFTRRAAPAAASVAPTTQLRTAEARLADVERLFKTGSLTEGEYKMKRQELVKQL